MKRKVTFSNNLHPEKEQHIPYSRSLKAGSRLYRPCADNKGLHCEGDRFGYVVEWEIMEEKSEVALIR